MQNSLITKHYYSIIFLLVFHTFSFAQKSLAPDSVAVQVNGTAIYERNVSDKMQTLKHNLKKRMVFKESLVKLEDRTRSRTINGSTELNFRKSSTSCIVLIITCVMNHHESY